MHSPHLDRLTRYHQQHLLQFYDRLDEVQRQSLDRQIAGVDLPQLAELFNKFGDTDAWAELAMKAESPPAIRLDEQAGNFVARSTALRRGEAALAAGQVGMILVAGGQGSRLGFDHPKGMFPLGPVSQRTLFQIHIDKLKAINAKFSVTVPLYVMTSPATHDETEAFLLDRDWFGYPASARRIFCQGTMSAVDARTGQILMSRQDRLFASPDGHGGMLAALHHSGGLEDMRRRQLQQIFYCQIDNPLSQICDAATIGYHLLAESEMSSQAVPKTDPLQKVGNIVSIDGQLQIIEYSDLPDEVARRRNPDGSLTLWAGNIAVHVFEVAFLERMSGQTDALPFHLAHKKVAFIDSSGNLVHPDQPNAIKFERFIFDLLPMAQRSIVVEVDPADAFAPVKNAANEKSNTAFTAQQAMIAQARRLLAEVGVQVPPDVAVELDPSLMLDQEKLKTAIRDGSRLSQATFLQ